MLSAWNNADNINQGPRGGKTRKPLGYSGANSARTRVIAVVMPSMHDEGTPFVNNLLPVGHSMRDVSAMVPTLIVPSSSSSMIWDYYYTWYRFLSSNLLYMYRCGHHLRNSYFARGSRLIGTPKPSTCSYRQVLTVLYGDCTKDSIKLSSNAFIFLFLLPPRN